MTREGPPAAIEAEPDGDASVSFEESPTTGYRWVLEDPGQARHVSGAAFVEDKARAAGGGGTRTFRLSLQELDTVELVFVLRRQPGTAAIERRVVTVARQGRTGLPVR